MINIRLKNVKIWQYEQQMNNKRQKYGITNYINDNMNGKKNDNTNDINDKKRQRMT